MVDGKGATSRPIHVIVMEVEISSLSPQTAAEIKRIQNLGSQIKNIASESSTVMILDPDILSALDLERWAIEYAYKFTKDYNVHATAFLLGIEYVERKLPHVSQLSPSSESQALRRPSPPS